MTRFEKGADNSEAYEKAKERAREANRADHLGSSLDIEEVVRLPKEDAGDIVRPTESGTPAPDRDVRERPKAA